MNISIHRVERVSTHIKQIDDFYVRNFSIVTREGTIEIDLFAKNKRDLLFF